MYHNATLGNPKSTTCKSLIFIGRGAKCLISADTWVRQPHRKQPSHHPANLHAVQYCSIKSILGVTTFLQRHMKRCTFFLTHLYSDVSPWDIFAALAPGHVAEFLSHVMAVATPTFYSYWGASKTARMDQRSINGQKQ